MQVTTREGLTFTEDNPTALAYYRLQEGYTVVDDETFQETVDVHEERPERPADSASKRDWYDYASATANDVPDYEDITHAELIETYGS